VVYGPGRPQGEALPELLTTSALLHAIDRASVRDDNRKSAESATLIPTVAMCPID
jgi:suppressor for copper-sensitivity B